VVSQEETMKKSFKETSKLGAVAWLLQRISAVILFVLLLFHFISYHFISKGVFPWDKVVEKMQSPWFNLMQFLFLVTALYHGLNGIWMVTEDYIHNKNMRMVIFSLLVFVGLSLFFVGIHTIFKVANLNIAAVAGS
jgi:succinate dehydrogenase / fumarate reductase membrane anchor subunit